jgi:hypothetical protein
MDGLLQKRSSSRPYKWQTRHFVLEDGRLAYFKDAKEGRPKLKEWDLSYPNTLAFVPKKACELEIHCGGIAGIDTLLTLRADSAQTANAWVETIHAHIKTASNVAPPHASSGVANQLSASSASALMNRYPTAKSEIQQTLDNRAAKDEGATRLHSYPTIEQTVQTTERDHSDAPKTSTRSSRPPPPQSAPPKPPGSAPVKVTLTREALELFYEDHSANQQSYEENLAGIDTLLSSHSTEEILSRCEALYGATPQVR